MSMGSIPDAELPDRVKLKASLDRVPRNAREFQGHRAGVVTRLIANVIDFVVILLALVGGYITWFAVDFVVHTYSFKPPKPSLALTLIAGAIIGFIYLTAAWATSGRSFGNLLLGLRVVNWHGNKVSWLVAALRAAFCLWFVPGFFWVAISHKNRSVQDIVLRTSVIYDWTIRADATPEDVTRLT